MKRTTAQPKALGYLRVSTDAQADSGLGLDAQRAAISAAAARLGLPLADTFTDAGLSGALDVANRPGLFAALNALRRGDALIVAKRDRLGRDVIAVAMMERLITRKGARVLSAAGEGTDNDSPASMLQRRMLDAFAEYERLIIGQRTKAALRAKRQRGERAGNLPFGYQLASDGRTLLPSLAEQRIIGIVRQLREAGYTLRAIADRLNGEGYTTRRGSAWRHQFVANITKALPGAA
jgi:DNA invertase Pin-like site-specific DNA recombinase